MKRIKKTNDWQPIDFRYDECIRGRSDEDIAPTLTASSHSLSSCPLIGGGLSMIDNQTNIEKLVESGEIKFRRFTPKTYLKLMGFDSNDYEKIKFQPESIIYHEGGDSICTTVLCAIFGKLLGIDYEPIINNYVETLKGEKDGTRIKNT